MEYSKRQLKIARQLQKDLSDIFRLKLNNQFKNTLITITRVEVSPDLSVARIYVSIMASGNSDHVIEQITNHKNEIRGALGRRIGKQVRKIPQLVFIEDRSYEHASNIEELLSKLDIPPQSE